MGNQRHINTFEGGMSQDLDSQFQRQNTYLYAMNLRFIFNEDGTYSAENELGNSHAFSIDSDYGNAADGNYFPIGGCELNGKLVVLSTNESNGHSEIGVVTQNQFDIYEYQTIFNDKYDPLGGRLKFSRRFQTQPKGLVESATKESIYWNDDNNEPRCMNILYASVNNVQIVSNVYNDTAYSVSGFSQSIDLTWGIIKYKETLQNAGGNLTTARYQYTYRYVHASGFSSVFAPPCNFITVALQTPNAAQASNDKWTGYNILETGAATNKSIRINLKYLDTRYKYVEVCAVQWESDTSFTRAVVFGRFEIPANGELDVEHKTMIGKEVTIDQISQQYLSIKAAKTDVIKDNSYIMGNIVEYKKIELDEALIGGVTVAPKLRLMKSDTTNQGAAFPVTNQVPTARSAVSKNLFGSVSESYEINNEYINYKGTQWEHLFPGFMRGERYRFGVVWFDRKGQRSFVQHLCDVKFPEQYGSDFKVYTKDGVTTVPTTDDFSLTQWGQTMDVVLDGDPTASPARDPILQGSDFSVKIMGLTLSNIKIPHNVLYDENGNLNISGFSIVRCDLPRSIISQGLLLNTVRDDTHEDILVADTFAIWNDAGNGEAFRAPSGYGRGNTIGSTNKWGRGFKVVRPLPTEHNWHGGDSDWHASDTVAGGAPGVDCPDRFGIKTQWDGPSSVGIVTGFTDHSNQYIGCLSKTEIPTSPSNMMRIPFITKKNVFTFECPEYMFDQSVLEQGLSQAKMELVGICVKNEGANWIKYPDTGIVLGPDDYKPNIIYGKFYGSVPASAGANVRNNLNGAPSETVGHGFGTSETIKLLGADVRTFALSDTDYKYDEYSGVSYYGNTPQTPVQCASARSHQKTVVVELNDGNIKSASLRIFDASGSSGGSDPNYAMKCYYLANYRANDADWIPTQSELESSVYKNVGHFVPINNELLNSIGVTPTNGVDAVFDNVEVWGGDTYTDFFTYCRLEPEYCGPGYYKEADGDYYSSDEDTSTGFTTHEFYPDYSIGVSFPCETRVNLMMRAGDEYSKVGAQPMCTWNEESSALSEGIYVAKVDLSDAKLEEFIENKVFLAKDADSFNAKDALFVSDETDFPTKGVWTQVKVYGEFNDSFRTVLVNSFRFANGIYGEITQLEALFDRIYVIQKTGFGYFPFKEKTAIATADGGELVTGNGVGLSDVEYINTKIGSQHQWSIANSGKGIYGVDAYAGKLWRFAGDGMIMLSDERKQHSYFTKKLKEYWSVIDESGGADSKRVYDNPCYLGGISGVWDKEHNDVIFTFTKRRAVRSAEDDDYETVFEGLAETISYNENDNAFKSFHPFTPSLYLTHNGSLLSIANQRESLLNPTGQYARQFWVHGRGNRGSFYGQTFDSIIRFAVNPAITNLKIFDNVRININNDGMYDNFGYPTASAILKTVIAKTQNQQEQIITLNNKNTDDRPRYRQDFLSFPLRQKDKYTSGPMNGRYPDRVRGKHVILEYTIDNSVAGNIKIRITEHETIYSFSKI